MAKDDNVVDVKASEVNVVAGDLFKHQFAASLVGGYSRRDVDEFVERTAEEMHRLERTLEKMEAEKTALQRKLDALHDRESALRDALVNAQQFGEKLVENAEREAAAIRAEAEAHRQRMLLDAQRRPDALEREIRELEERRDRLMRDLRAVLETHQKLLDTQVSADAPAPEAAKKPAIGSAFADEEAPLHEPEIASDEGDPDIPDRDEIQRRVRRDVVELSDIIDSEDRE